MSKLVQCSLTPSGGWRQYVLVVANAAHGSGSHVSHCNHIFCMASTTNRNDLVVKCVNTLQVQRSH